ncbi:uncharacterized protein VK521_013004 isoform 1-T1 [Ammospiza maritima maritima]
MMFEIEASADQRLTGDHGALRGRLIAGATWIPITYHPKDKSGAMAWRWESSRLGIPGTDLKIGMSSWLLFSPGSAIYLKERQPGDVSKHLLQHLRFCNSLLNLE